MYPGRIGNAHGEKYTSTPSNNPIVKIAPAERSTSAKENLMSSALPSAAASTVESNSSHPPVGVPELSLATM